MTIRSSAMAALAAAAFSLSKGASRASQAERVMTKRAAIVAARNAAKAGDDARLGASLAVLEKAAAHRVAHSDVTNRVTRKNPALRASEGTVAVSAYGDDLGALRAQLVAKGLLGANQHDTAVSGRAPIAALRDMAATPGLKLVRPTLAMTRAGSAVTQGDRSVLAGRAGRRRTSRPWRPCSSISVSATSRPAGGSWVPGIRPRMPSSGPCV